MEIWVKNMSIWKHYFNDSKERVGYLTEIWNKNGGENIDIEEYLQFPECDGNLNDEILKRAKLLTLREMHQVMHQDKCIRLFILIVVEIFIQETIFFLHKR